MEQQTERKPIMPWQTDPSHTRIEFVARHMMLSKVRGEFQDFDVDFQIDPERPEAASVEARIKTASVNTRDEKRDDHLRSPDFFNAEKYPEMVFRSTRRAHRRKKRQAARQPDHSRSNKTGGTGCHLPWQIEVSLGNHQRWLRGVDQDQPRGLGVDLERGAGERRLAGW